MCDSTQKLFDEGPGDISFYRFSKLLRPGTSWANLGQLLVCVLESQKALNVSARLISFLCFEAECMKLL